MSTKQENRLQGMLTDINFDPEGFKKCVEERRKQGPLASNRSAGGESMASMATESLCSENTEGMDTDRTDLSESGEIYQPIPSPVIRQGCGDDYKVFKTIGKGKFSEVYYAERKEDAHPCALKKVDLPNADNDANSKLMKEVRLLQGLSHPNIISYLDSFVEECTLNIVLEWAGGGDLKQLLRNVKRRKARLHERTIWMYFSQCCEAVKHMHDHRVIHRDVKPANVFVMPNGRLKLGDLGLSRQMHECSLKAFSQVGTPLYMSPEVLRGEGHDFASDVWSMGCVLYELAVLRSPFEKAGLSIFELFQNIMRGDYPAMTELYSQELRDMVDSMVALDPLARPDTDEIAADALLIRTRTPCSDDAFSEAGLVLDETEQLWVPSSDAAAVEGQVVDQEEESEGQEGMESSVDYGTVESADYATVESANYATVQEMPTGAVDDSVAEASFGNKEAVAAAAAAIAISRSNGSPERKHLLAPLPISLRNTLPSLKAPLQEAKASQGGLQPVKEKTVAPLVGLSQRERGKEKGKERGKERGKGDGMEVEDRMHRVAVEIGVEEASEEADALEEGVCQEGVCQEAVAEDAAMAASCVSYDERVVLHYAEAPLQLDAEAPLQRDGVTPLQRDGEALQRQRHSPPPLQQDQSRQTLQALQQETLQQQEALQIEQHRRLLTAVQQRTQRGPGQGKRQEHRQELEPLQQGHRVQQLQPLEVQVGLQREEGGEAGGGGQVAEVEQGGGGGSKAEGGGMLVPMKQPLNTLPVLKQQPGARRQGRKGDGQSEGGDDEGMVYEGMEAVRRQDKEDVDVEMESFRWNAASDDSETDGTRKRSWGNTYTPTEQQAGTHSHGMSTLSPYTDKQAPYEQRKQQALLMRTAPGRSTDVSTSGNERYSHDTHDERYSAHDERYSPKPGTLRRLDTFQQSTSRLRIGPTSHGGHGSLPSPPRSHSHSISHSHSNSHSHSISGSASEPSSRTASARCITPFDNIYDEEEKLLMDQLLSGRGEREREAKPSEGGQMSSRSDVNDDRPRTTVMTQDEIFKRIGALQSAAQEEQQLQLRLAQLQQQSAATAQQLGHAVITPQPAGSAPKEWAGSLGPPNIGEGDDIGVEGRRPVPFAKMMGLFSRMRSSSKYKVNQSFA
jgi:NIMA (never in mitosis gene a)-related kinase